MKKLFVPALLGAVLIAAAWFGYTYLQRTKVAAINNYEKCVKAGYPATLSYPSTCKTPDGRTFVEQI